PILARIAEHIRHLLFFRQGIAPDVICVAIKQVALGIADFRDVPVAVGKVILQPVLSRNLAGQQPSIYLPTKEIKKNIVAVLLGLYVVLVE
ncbi:hypothetical protein LQV63_31325, partial [Paenibacillus profundus]